MYKHCEGGSYTITLTGIFTVKGYYCVIASVTVSRIFHFVGCNVGFYTEKVLKDFNNSKKKKKKDGRMPVGMLQL